MRPDPATAARIGATLLVLLLGLVFAAPLLEGRLPLTADTGVDYTLRRFYAEHLRRGEFPLNNTGLFLGQYGPANPVAGLFSPTFLPMLVWPRYETQVFEFVLHGWIAALGMLLFVRRASGSLAAGAVAASAFVLGGAYFSMHQNFHYMASATLLPWLLLATERALARAGALRFVPVGVVLALMALQGDLISPAPACLLVAARVLGGPREPGGAARFGRDALVAGATALGLAAIQLLPTASLFRESPRSAGLPFAESSAFSLHPIELLGLLVPALFGVPSAPEGSSFWGQAFASPLPGQTPRFWYDSLYLGVPVLALAALGFRATPWGRRPVVLLAVLALLLGLAFGRTTPLHTLACDWIPGYAALRFPAKWFLPVHFVLAAASGFGAARLLRGGAGAGGDATLLRTLGAAALVALLVAAAVGPGSQTLAALLGSREAFAREGGTAAWSALQRHAIASVLAAGALGGLALLAQRGPAARRWLGAALAGLVGADLLIALPPAQTTSLAMLADRSDAIDYLRASTPGRPRIYRATLLNSVSSGSWLETVQLDFGILYGIDYAFGYDATTPARFGTVIFEADHPFYDAIPLWAPRLGITHVLGFDRPPVPWVAGLRGSGLVREERDFPDVNLRIFRLAVPPGRVRWVPEVLEVASGDAALAQIRSGTVDPARTAVVERAPVLLEGRESEGPGPPPTPVAEGGAPPGIEVEETPDRLRIHYESGRPGFLVLAQAFRGGWGASLDGAPVPIYRTEYLVSGVAAPAGSHEVLVRFDPPSFRLGLATSGATLLALSAGALLRRRRPA